MPDRFWVGGTANWDGTAGTKWAATSGGAGGQSVPTSADDVFFDAASGAVTCTVSTTTGICRSLTFTGFTGTLAGSTNLQVNGNLTVAAGMTWTHTGTINFQGTGGITSTITTNGKTISPVTVARSALTVVLADALTSSGSITVTEGTFTTNNYAVTAGQLSSNNSNTRTINLGSSTVNLSGFLTAIDFTTSTNLTFNAGTSQINLNNGNTRLFGGSRTFYNVASTSSTPISEITGANTFNNFSVAGRVSAGVSPLSISANQTINGTLTLSAGTNATMRTFVRSDVIGTTRTLTCAAVASLTDIDFRDITIAGAAAPVSGTRLGDCKGNSGITFPAAKTVYWVNSGGTNWSGPSTVTSAWALTSGGTQTFAAFPLAQDTAVFDSTLPTSGSTATINAAYNIGTIDMSARTSNTMFLATGTQTPTIYGNWINGTGTTLTGAGIMTFAGRGSQTITSAGKTFTQAITINSPGGSVTFQDAFTNNNTSASGALVLTSGSFSDGGFNCTLSSTNSGSRSFDSSNTNTRSLSINGTWTLAPNTATIWNCATSTNLTVTGTGTISLTSASAKTFAGGGIQTYPTLNQGGVGTLTVTGSNKFAGLTNTAIGRIQFQSNTTNEFTSFSINGTAGNLLQLGSASTTQATLQKSTAWLMGANSTDAGNNTGLSFTAGGGIDYLSVSYINGTVVAPPATNTGNFFAFF